MPTGVFDHSRSSALRIKSDATGMSKFGETKRTRNPNGRFRLEVFHPCVDCGKERWVQLIGIRKDGGRPQFIRCLSCGAKRRGTNEVGENNPAWKGGRIKDDRGYIRVKLSPDNFFYPMAEKRHYVFEHRLVIAKHLGRCLHSWEIVHHKNHIRDDNRLENLQLLPTARQHLPSPRWRYELAKRDKRIAQLEARLILLEAENVLLKSDEVRFR